MGKRSTIAKKSPKESKVSKVIKAPKDPVAPKVKLASREHIGSLELLVLLAVLRLSDKAFGIEIASTITEAGITVQPGAVYTTIARMEKKNMIRGRLGKSTPVRGGRAKRYFTLSATGDKAVRRAYQGIKKLADGSL